MGTIFLPPAPLSAPESHCSDGRNLHRYGLLYSGAAAGSVSRPQALDPQNFPPVRKINICGDNRRILFIAFRYQQEKEFRCFRIQRKKAHFIHNQKLILRIMFQTLFQSVLLLQLLQIHQKCVTVYEISGFSVSGCIDSKGSRKVGFAYSW